MATETCESCKRIIGELEQAYTWQSHILCKECYARLSNPTVAQPIPVDVHAPVILPPPQRSLVKSTLIVMATVIALLVLAVSLFYLVNYIHKKDQLGEKDVKLLEAFVREMNLLNEVKLTDERADETQRVKFNAAYHDLSDLGSSNHSMIKMSGLAFDVWIKYDFAHHSWEMGELEEYKKKENDASKSRENFVKAFRLLQGLESERKDEATSK
jgi:hypothetical protein